MSKLRKKFMFPQATRITKVFVLTLLVLSCLVPVLVNPRAAYADDTFIKLPNPATLPTGNGDGVAFSHDATYMAIAHPNSPYVTIYKRSGDTFTKLPNPATLPAGTGCGVAFSHDSTYLAVAHANSPYITIYKRSGDTFTKLPNPATLPTGTGNGIAFSHDSSYLAVAHVNSPFVTIYKRDGDTFTKLANPATLPTSTGCRVAFSHDSTYLAVDHYNSPYVTIYKRDGDTFTKLDNPATLPAGTGYGVAFNHDSTYMAVGHVNSPFVTIYSRSGDIFTKLANPATLPPNQGNGVAFSHDSTYLAMGHVNSPFVTIYSRSGDIFTKLANPAALPAATGWGAAFSHDSTYLAVTHNNSPYVTIYKKVASPTLVAAATNAAGTVITITFSKNMANPAGKHGQFSYSVNGGAAQNFSTAALNADNTKLDLTCAGTAIAFGNTVTVSYTKGTVLAADDGVLESFTDQAVTNNVPPPTRQVNTATGTGIATFTTSAGGITGLTSMLPSAAPCPPKIDLSFPHGLFSFNVINVTPGATVTITITLPSSAPAGTQYWKCINGQWVNCTSFLGSNDGDNVITLTITDGGPLDADGVANGTIVDPGGPAVTLGGAAVPAHKASPTLPTQLKPAQMSLQYLSVNPKQAVVNQPVTISTNVVNTGDEAGNLNITLKINGRVELTKMVSVGPHGTQPVKFILTRSQSGTYAVDIGDQKGSFTILGTGASTRAPVSGGLIALLVMAILVLTIVVVLMLSFRRPA